MLSYILTFFGGMFLGIVVSCILLAKKNLEAAKKVEDGMSNTLSNTWAASKAAHKAEFERLENLNNGGQYQTDEAEEETEENTENED